MGLGQEELDRMAAMLSRLGSRGYCVRGEAAAYGDAADDCDFDPDSDFDLGRLRPLSSWYASQASGQSLHTIALALALDAGWRGSYTYARPIAPVY